MMLKSWSTAVLIIAMLISPAGLVAGKFNKQLSIGDAAPAWDGLRGIDGKLHSLKQLADAKAVVVYFTANRCPVAQAYEPRFQQLVNDYRDRGVAFVAVSVSRHPNDSFDKMQARAHDRKFTYAYLHDPSQELGRQYGVVNTPTAFVFDQDRKLVYMGTLDDRWQDGAAVETHYLRDALTALLDDRRIPIRETRPTGCEIEYAVNE